MSAEQTADVSGPAQAAGKRHTGEKVTDEHPQRFGRAVQENLAETIQPGDSKDIKDMKKEAEIAQERPYEPHSTVPSAR